MRVGEFCKNCNLSVKTAKWLYRNVFNDNAVDDGKHKHFTVENVQWVKEHQKGFFDKNLNLKRLKECSDECYICDDGRVFTYKRGFYEERKPYLAKCDYYYIILWNNAHVTYRLHRLVAKYFVPNLNGYDIVNHIDGDKHNNVATNLEWTTISKNTKHAYDMGLAHNDKGFEDSQSFPIKIIDEFGNVFEYGSISEASRITSYGKSFLARLAKTPNRVSRKYKIRVEYINKV